MCCVGCALSTPTVSWWCCGTAHPTTAPVREMAAGLGITLLPLPGDSPDLVGQQRCPTVAALWRWLREDVTYHHCHASLADLTRRVATFQARINQEPCVVADRLWAKDRLDPEEEKLRFSN